MFPADEWGDRDFNEVLPPQRIRDPDGAVIEQPHAWELRTPRTVELKNIGDVEVREIVNHGIHLPWQSAEERAREGLAEFKKARLRAAVELARRVAPTPHG